MAWTDPFGKKKKKRCLEIFASLCDFVVDMTKRDTLKTHLNFLKT